MKTDKIIETLEIKIIKTLTKDINQKEMIGTNNKLPETIIKELIKKTPGKEITVKKMNPTPESKDSQKTNQLKPEASKDHNKLMHQKEITNSTNSSLK